MTMTTFKLGFWMLLHMAVLCFAGFMMIVSVYPVYAQRDAQDLGQRIGSDELTFDHRLTVIETKLDNDTFSHNMSLSGIALLLGEKMITILKKRVKGDTE
jgi:hypothetical protein